MNLIEKYASLVLAEKIAKGEAFNEGMDIVLPSATPLTVKATKEIVEAAARTALERDEHGYELGETDRPKAAKPVVKTEGKV